MNLSLVKRISINIHIIYLIPFLKSLKHIPLHFSKQEKVMLGNIWNHFVKIEVNCTADIFQNQQKAENHVVDYPPYLAWGNISIRQAFQYVKNHPNYVSNKRAFNGLLTRLKWHCHFIQKFENESLTKHNV